MEVNKILVNFYYKSNENKLNVEVVKLTTLKELKEKIERRLNFPLDKFKLMYKTNTNILLINENFKFYDFFGETKKVDLEITSQEFTEQSFIDKFEKAYNDALNIEKNEKNENFEEKNEKNKKKYLKDPLPKQPQLNFNNNVLCVNDKLNKATYVCTKCMNYWCAHCIHLEVHKKELVQLTFLKDYLKLQRQMFLKEIHEKVMNNHFFENLEKIDFVLNDKVSKIEEQFKEIQNIILNLKETQTKILLEVFYQQVNNKNFKNVSNDIKFLNAKVQEIDNTADNYTDEENISNNETLNKFKKLILKNFSEFGEKFSMFWEIQRAYENFNTLFISQLNGKLKQNSEIYKGIIESNNNNLKNVNKSNNENEIGNNNTSLNTQILLKMKYYNNILVWDQNLRTSKKIKEINDKSDFRLNYQIYGGNIFLNKDNKLYIVTGQQFNKMYYYDLELNEIFFHSNLNNNHCRGAIIYCKARNSLIVLSGKYTNKCEELMLGKAEENIEDGNITEKVRENNKGDQVTGKGGDSLSKSYVGDNSKTKQPLMKRLYEKGNNKPENELNKSTELDKQINAYKASQVNQTGSNSNSNNNNTQVNNANWLDFPELNYQRYNSSFTIFNDRYLYAFFGYNSSRGVINTIESIDISPPSLSDSTWQIINFNNPHTIECFMEGHGSCYANPDEVYILGGSSHSRYSDRIFKYNFVHNSIYKTDFIIPGLSENEYYRFWEENQFKSLFSNDIYSTNDDQCNFGMWDAKDKMHIFNLKTFKYNVV